MSFSKQSLGDIFIKIRIVHRLVLLNYFFICLLSGLTLSLNSEQDEKNQSIQQKFTNSFQRNRSGSLTEKTVCPNCGFNSKKLTDSTNVLHKIIECYRYNDTKIMNLRPSHLKSLPSYKCSCKYSILNDKICLPNSKKNDHNSNYTFTVSKSYELSAIDIDDTKSKEISSVAGECLVAHVGMAINGFNLIYKPWINREHCFNLCLNTNINNGDSFDCRSFEHWKKNCKAQFNTQYDDKNNTHISDLHTNCSSFDDDYDLILKKNPSSNNHRHHKNLNEFISHKSDKKRTAGKSSDICVLSDQTIRSPGVEFTPNHGVIYYELLCKSKYYHFKIQTYV